MRRNIKRLNREKAAEPARETAPISKKKTSKKKARKKKAR